MLSHLSAGCAMALVIAPLSAQASRWIHPKPQVAPTPRHGHAMVFDSSRGQVVLFGGATQKTFSQETWVLEGNRWTLRTPKTSPYAMFWHAMAYDEARREVVLFSSFGQGRLRETWTWDGTDWKQHVLSRSPTAVSDFAMAYDANRKRTVLFGGLNQPASETWEWDGKLWHLVKPTPSPPGVYSHALAYDSIRKEVVLFGGYAAPNIPNQDTWTYDGRTWTKKSPQVSPPARGMHAMTFDRHRGKILLFGGFLYPTRTALGDAWEWDGKLWSRLSLPGAPPARWSFAMAYDAAAEEVVLFGGLGSGTPSPVIGDLWRLGHGPSASTQVYGANCGTKPGVQLGAAPGSLPVLGDTLRVEIRGLPPTPGVGLLALGSSRSLFLGLPLPLDLTPFGMKGCLLHQDFQHSLVFAIQQGLGTQDLAIPYLGRLKGSRAYLQAFGVDRAATSSGLVSSNGLELRIGYR